MEGVAIPSRVRYDLGTGSRGVPTTTRQDMASTFTCPDGFDYQAPAGFTFATFRKNWRDEWELDNFHSTESSAKQAICELLSAKIPVAFRALVTA